MQTEQTKTYTSIKIETFVTPEGKPTCSAGLSKDCKFLRLTRWGCTFICGYNSVELNRGDDERKVRNVGNGGYGYLVPDGCCPLHDNGGGNT